MDLPGGAGRASRCSGDFGSFGCTARGGRVPVMSMAPGQLNDYAPRARKTYVEGQVLPEGGEETGHEDPPLVKQADL